MGRVTKPTAATLAGNAAGAFKLGTFLLFATALLLLSSCSNSGSDDASIATGNGKGHDYIISVNSELGMHFSSFDYSYMVLLPPYSSIQSQIVKNGKLTKSGMPMVLQADENDPSVILDSGNKYKLHYEHIGNSYSEGNKMAWWSVPYDINSDGNPYGANESLANRYFSHLYTYEGRKGKKEYLGKGIPIPLNAGITGKPLSGSYLDFSGDEGVTLFTKSTASESMPMVLVNPGIWNAIGLPLTPFSDDAAAKGIIKLKETDIQPYQRVRVTLVNANTGAAIIDGSSGKPVSFTGANPVDIPSCYNCHSNDNANGAKYGKYKTEFDYWVSIGASEWYSRIKASSISIMEIHDDKHGTEFLKNYSKKASSNRLGRTPVLCQSCHADNIIGKLISKKVAGKNRKISSLTEAIHNTHQRLRPMADSQGRSGGCQSCHPAHRSDKSLDGFPISKQGKNLFEQSDNRNASGGSYLGRDAHSNKNLQTDGAETAEHLNAIGQYMKDNVLYDNGTYKGLWCTNCHSQLSRELYERDNIKNSFLGDGSGIRDKTLKQIAEAIGVSKMELINRYIDPRVPQKAVDKDSGVLLTWSANRMVPSMAVVEARNGKPAYSKDADGNFNIKILSKNPSDSAKFKNGMLLPYSAVSDGKDYWLSAGEPHCADCHKPPFVEGQGGVAFPFNQAGKHSLMRYSKGHAGLACQFCHQSAHGTSPVTDGVDAVSYSQAASMNADGSHGPVKCAACHEVNSAGVPTFIKDESWNGKPVAQDYGAAVSYMHSMAKDLGGANPAK